MIASLVICCHDSLLPICWLWNLFKVKPVGTNVIGDSTSDHHAKFKNIHETDAEKKDIWEQNLKLLTGSIHETRNTHSFTYRVKTEHFINKGQNNGHFFSLCVHVCGQIFPFLGDKQRDSLFPWTLNIQLSLNSLNRLF